jgi:outer membrane biogenesis lipoprotein LolB
MLENVLNRKLLIAALASILLGACAGPGPGLTGNDTGGIITWSPEHQHMARDWAGEHCARYGKFARITSIHRQYGDYIAFSCQFDRRKRPPG